METNSIEVVEYFCYWELGYWKESLEGQERVFFINYEEMKEKTRAALEEASYVPGVPIFSGRRGTRSGLQAV
ncbi:hypothetical protein ACLB2K_002203 [Fragaria x ananassa]